MANTKKPLDVVPVLEYYHNNKNELLNYDKDTKIFSCDISELHQRTETMSTMYLVRSMQTGEPKIFTYRQTKFNSEGDLLYWEFIHYEFTLRIYND